jgi:FAD/FMN-containing dehydrogenase
MDLSTLKQNFKGEITTHEADIEHFSRDASIFQIAPSAIVSPKDTADIKSLVKFVVDQKASHPDLSLTPRGGGTDMTGGSINDSLIIDTTKHLNTISELTDQSVTTQPGVMFRDLEVKLSAKNRMMPAYPVSKAWVAVGGMVGNNCGGEKTFKYGQAKDFVEELEVVLADGNAYIIKPLTEAELNLKIARKDFEGQFYRDIYKLITDNYRLLQEAKPTTSKNSSGYYLWDVWDGKTFDLTQLFVGSQGTLGIITKIKWRIVPVHRHSKLVVFFLKDLKQLGQIVTHVNELKPESFEIFDKHTLSLALKYLPEIVAKMKGNRAVSSLKLFWEFLPEIWMAIRGGLPEVVLLAEFTGDDEKTVMAQAMGAANNIRGHFNLPTHIAKDLNEAQKYWTIRRESYNLLRQHNARKVSAPFIEDIVVHPDQLPEFMPKLDAILAKYPDFVYTIAGHAGDANFHIIPLVDVSEEKHRQQIIQMSDEVFHLVREYNGSMAGEHNDGLVRGTFLPFMFGEKVFAIFKRTKEIFDPLNIFNPHKKTEADLEFYAEHIRHH